MLTQYLESRQITLDLNLWDGQKNHYVGEYFTRFAWHLWSKHTPLAHLIPLVLLFDEQWYYLAMIVKLWRFRIRFWFENDNVLLEVCSRSDNFGCCVYIIRRGPRKQYDETRAKWCEQIQHFRSSSTFNKFEDHVSNDWFKVETHNLTRLPKNICNSGGQKFWIESRHLVKKLYFSNI